MGIVTRWSPVAIDTVGKQLIRAADRVGATLVEGDGRYGRADALHFFVMARASARETRYWIERAIVRSLITAQEGQAQIEAVNTATRQLNSLIRYRREQDRSNGIHDARIPYEMGSGDSFVDE